MVTNPVDGAAARVLHELRLAPRKHRDEPHLIQAMAHGEVTFASGAREFVPRANELTVIAAVDPIANGASKLDRDRSLELDGEIGNAAPGVESVGRDNGAGRTGGQTGRAAAAMRGSRLVERQIDVHIDLAEEEIRAGVAVDQIRVFPDPTQPGVARQRFFENGGAVGEYAVAERSNVACNAIAELLQTLAHELVIIAAQRV